MTSNLMMEVLYRGHRCHRHNCSSSHRCRLDGNPTMLALLRSRKGTVQHRPHLCKGCLRRCGRTLDLHRVSCPHQYKLRMSLGHNQRCCPCRLRTGTGLYQTDYCQRCKLLQVLLEFPGQSCSDYVRRRLLVGMYGQ